MALQHATHDSAPAAPAEPAKRHGSPRGYRARLLRGIATLFAAAALVFVAGFLGGLVYFSDMIEPHQPLAPSTSQGVVAVTGGAQRVADGLALLRQGQGQRLLISGVHERTGHDEIQKLNPQARELIQCCVDLGAQARNTIGNAIEARRWARLNGFRSLTVVTSNYHMPRVLLEFRHVMPDVEFATLPVVSDGFDLSRWWLEPGMTRTLVAEYVKFLAAWVRTRFEGDPETSRIAVIFSGRKPVSPKVIPGAMAGN